MIGSAVVRHDRRANRHSITGPWTIGRVLVLVLITAHVLAVIFPFVWMLYSSLKTQREFISNVWSLPSSLNLDAYRTATLGGDLLGYATNSAIVTVSSVLAIVLASTAAGYALAIYRPRWVPAVEVGLLMAMAIPAYVALVPLVIMLRSAGLLDSLFGLILPTVAFNIPVSVFILRAHFATLPVDLLEAARIDGAGELRIFARIGIPLAVPAMFTIAIINIVWVWNDFLFPLVFINSPTKQTLAVGLTQFQGEHVTQYPVLMAAITLAALFTFLLYTIFQRQVVGGLTSGAVK